MSRAILLTGDRTATRATLTDVELPPLADGEVEIRVRYSTLNFKDALAITCRGAIVKTWPMVPGIDLAGTVEASSHPAWRPGDPVVVTGWGLGETIWGGLSTACRLPAAYLLRPPPPFSLRDCMAIGTAGVTAALSVEALRRHGVKPSDGDVLVTGAAGGVGSIAVALLSKLGYAVTASTGRPDQSGYLERLGARRVIDRAELSAPGKPLQSERWSGVVDSVGSHTLANACASTKWYGAVAACGLAQGADFPATVMPFILRGVSLLGINSVFVPNRQRYALWNLLASKLDTQLLASMTSEIGLSEAIDFAPEILAGRVRGRTVVDVSR